MKKQQFAMIAMGLNTKHKYLSNFDCFSLQSNALLAHWIVTTPFFH